MKSEQFVRVNIQVHISIGWEACVVACSGRTEATELELAPICVCGTSVAAATSEDFGALSSSSTSGRVVSSNQFVTLPSISYSFDKIQVNKNKK